jgi:hypothetical protein
MIKYKSFISVHSVVAVFETQKKLAPNNTKRRMKDEG